MVQINVKACGICGSDLWVGPILVRVRVVRVEQLVGFLSRHAWESDGKFLVSFLSFELGSMCWRDGTAEMGLGMSARSFGEGDKVGSHRTRPDIWIGTRLRFKTNVVIFTA
jgi:hypothetical protein